MDVVALLKADWPNAVAVAGAGWALLKVYTAKREATQKQRTDLVKIAQEAAAGVIDDLQQHIDRLHGRIQALEEELMLARKEHSDTIAAKDAELSLLRGRLRQALANVEAYERLLTANKIPHPQPMQAFYLVEAGDYPTDVQPI